MWLHDLRGLDFTYVLRGHEVIARRGFVNGCSSEEWQGDHAGFVLDFLFSNLSPKL